MNKTSISDLKRKAKDQLLGNYGIATGSFALLFALIYVIMSIIMGALTTGFMGENPQPVSMTFSQQLITQAVGIVIGVISSTASVGYVYILKRIAEGDTPVLSDLFFVFRNHPDKVVIISLIMTVAQFVLLVPSTIAQNRAFTADPDTLDGRSFLIWVVLYLAGFIVSFIIDLMLAMSFMIYLDDTEAPVMDIVKRSVVMMKGNKFRYFYLILSFIGYWFLILLSLGIAMLWVIPYETMAMVEFYMDLRDRCETVEVEYL